MSVPGNTRLPRVSIPVKINLTGGEWQWDYLQAQTWLSTRANCTLNNTSLPSIFRQPLRIPTCISASVMLHELGGMIKNDNSRAETISCSSFIKRKRNTCLGAAIRQKVGQGDQSSHSRLRRKRSKHDKCSAHPADEVMTPVFVHKM